VERENANPFPPGNWRKKGKKKQRGLRRGEPNRYREKGKKVVHSREGEDVLKRRKTHTVARIFRSRGSGEAGGGVFC